MILVAGPYRGGTNDDPVKIQANVDAMEDMALKVFRRGHLPVMGEWFGKDADRLGLSGGASREDFERLLDNVNPQTGKELTRFTREGRRVAFELNFNAVKDASIAGVLAGDRNCGDPLVRWCHKEAVKYTLGLIEEDMQVRVREDGKGDSTENRTTGGMIAWMRAAWPSCVQISHQEPAPNPIAPNNTLDCSIQIRSQVANTLAGMILSQPWEASK